MINLGALSLGELGGERALEPGQPAERRAGPVPSGGRAGRAAGALALLIEEAVCLAGRLRAVVEGVHGEAGPSGARRAVLKDLARLGPQTVPQLARRRSVSRQHVQTQVNALAEAGYVERLANPAHRRSRLVDLTERGRDLVAGLERRESEALSALEVAVPGAELRRAVGVLRSLRESSETLLS